MEKEGKSKEVVDSRSPRVSPWTMRIQKYPGSLFIMGEGRALGLWRDSAEKSVVRQDEPALAEEEVG